MGRQARGTSYTWTGVVSNGAGELIDADVLVLSVLDPDGDMVSGFPVDLSVIQHLGLGIYAFDWTIPAGADLGTYAGDWSGTDSDGLPCAGQDFLDVVLPSQVTTYPEGTNPNPYMMPERFRALGYGANLRINTSDLQLETHLLDATAAVNAYCNVPLLPQPHSFLGGKAVDEEHPWKFPQTSTARGSRRVYPKHRPIKVVEDFRLIVGFDAGASLPLNALVVNNREGWIEITALTIANQSGLFGVSGWIVPMGGLVVPIARITYTYGNDFPVSNDRLRMVEPTVWQGRFGFWDANWPIVVKSHGDTVSDTEYDVDLDIGRITFTGTVPAEPLTVDYHHSLNLEIERATALIAAQFIEDDNLRDRGMGGLAKLRVNEIEATRIPRDKGDLSSYIANYVPSAATLLDGFRFWHAG